MSMIKSLLPATLALAMIGTGIAEERTVNFELVNPMVNDHGTAPFIQFNTLSDGSVTMTESPMSPNIEFSDLTLRFDSLPELSIDRLTLRDDYQGTCQSPYGATSQYYEGRVEDLWALSEVIVHLCVEMMGPEEISLNMEIGFAAAESYIGDPIVPESVPLANVQAYTKNITPVRVVDVFDSTFLGKPLKLTLEQQPGEIYLDYGSKFGFKVNTQWMGQEDKTLVISSQYSDPFDKAIGFDVIEDTTLPDFDQIQIRVRYKDSAGVLNQTDFYPLFMLMDETYGPLEIPAP